MILFICIQDMITPPLLNKSNKYKINKTLSEMKGGEINKYVNFIKKNKV